MNENIQKVTDEQKDFTATSMMRMMLHDLCEQNNTTFDEEFFKFSTSDTYDALFDFGTGMWREGPDYIRCLYDEERHLKGLEGVQ